MWKIDSYYKLVKNNLSVIKIWFQKVENWIPPNEDVKNSDPSVFLEKMDKKVGSQDVCKMEEEHYDR